MIKWFQWINAEGSTPSINKFLYSVMALLCVWYHHIDFLLKWILLSLRNLEMRWDEMSWFHFGLLNKSKMYRARALSINMNFFGCCFICSIFILEWYARKMRLNRLICKQTKCDLYELAWWCFQKWEKRIFEEFPADEWIFPLEMCRLHEITNVKRQSKNSQQQQ